MISLLHSLGLSVVLFILGLIGVVIRRNVLFMLLGLEIMLNAAAIAFVVAGSYLGQEDGQIMYILVITSVASESAIILAFLLQLYRRYYSLNIDNISELHG